MIWGFFRFIGRVAFASIFIISAVFHATNLRGTAKMIHSDFPVHLVGGADNAAVAAVGLMGVGGLLIALGVSPRLGSLLVAAFLVPATYFQHFLPMMAAQDEKAKKLEMIMVLKNVALLGAAFMIIGYEGAMPTEQRVHHKAKRN
eukprot:TRINITY_DN68630_c0_g1_i1.p1 TRINITY_DN68630_c0_g1~~TRINITY_DN68630_c0_g1_i1.p1  ORF type:complete len:145 (+),score=33.30 TRINITY_DN68630_c0_g1_i1:75-509(+)